ncbi:uncharacterized protein LOC5519088 isoform X2 [Nematostella vectensis]|uniref:uncharacterized protein LOC5519088 isoform X2 n=1 Tax=Nematostella vectensis TaxID=45351 RepID=UPI0020772DB5|nr:uncharacterized protein LOC5519088 isoform X2 [Nematostella vectensis]
MPDEDNGAARKASEDQGCDRKPFNIYISHAQSVIVGDNGAITDRKTDLQDVGAMNTDKPGEEQPSLDDDTVMQPGLDDETANKTTDVHDARPGLGGSEAVDSGPVVADSAEDNNATDTKDNFTEQEPPYYEMRSRSKCVENVEMRPVRKVSYRPRALSHSIVNRGFSTDSVWTADHLFKNPDGFLRALSAADEMERQRLENVLFQILLTLEKEHRAIKSKDIYNTLTTLACNDIGETATRHTLNLLLEELSRKADDFKGLFSVEQALRGSILREGGGLFDKESLSMQELRLGVYSRVLALLFVDRTLGNLTPLDAEISKLRDKLLEMLKNHRYQKHNDLRHAMEFIIEVAERTYPDPKRKKRDGGIKRNLVEILECWFELHLVVFVLQLKVYRKPKIMSVLKSLIDEYVAYGEKKRLARREIEWQNGLIFGSVLLDIAFYNKDITARSQASACLANFYKNSKDMEKCEGVKIAITRCCKRVLFSPDQLSRCLVGPHINNVSSEDDVDYLMWQYRKFVPPGNYEILRRDGAITVFSATFRDKPVIIKLCHASSDLDGVNYKRMRDEVYAMYRLNSSTMLHPNIPRVFAYDTEQLPYHVILERLPEGDLLSYLENSRRDLLPMLPQSILTGMCLDVLRAVKFLHQLGLVHRSICPSNVMVGEDNVCMLSGLGTVRELKSQGEGTTPEYVSNKSTQVRHDAPESLLDGRFSCASDMWSYGVLMYQVFTLGVTPYSRGNGRGCDTDEQVRQYVLKGGKLLSEACIPKQIAALIERCTEFDSRERPTAEEVENELEAYQSYIRSSGEDHAPESPPPLRKQLIPICNSSSSTPVDENEPTFPDVFEPPSPDSLTKSRWHGEIVNREVVNKDKLECLRSLRPLRHENLAEIKSISPLGSDFEVITEYFRDGDLLRHVRDGKCSPFDLVSALAQIAMVIQYIHQSDIVHCSLRPDNIMVAQQAPLKVKLTRFGRIEEIIVTSYMKTSADGFVVKPMPIDDSAWSAPEVKNDNYYSQAADVYSFGKVAFEMFNTLDELEASAAAAMDDQTKSSFEGNYPVQPQSMPCWLYITLKQCLLHYPRERPTFLLLVDTLTSRKPFDSWMLKHWKKIHNDVNVDFGVTQPENAPHVLPEEKHLNHAEIRKTVTDSLYAPHCYDYQLGLLRETTEEETYEYITENVYEEFPSQEIQVDGLPASSRSPKQDFKNSLLTLKGNPPPLPPRPPIHGLLDTKRMLLQPQRDLQGDFYGCSFIYEKDGNESDEGSGDDETLCGIGSNLYEPVCEYTAMLPDHQYVRKCQDLLYENITQPSLATCIIHQVSRPIPAKRQMPESNPTERRVSPPFPAEHRIPPPDPAERRVPPPFPAERRTPAPDPAERRVPPPFPAERRTPAPDPGERQISSPFPAERRIPPLDPAKRRVSPPFPAERRTPTPDPGERRVSPLFPDECQMPPPDPAERRVSPPFPAERRTPTPVPAERRVSPPSRLPPPSLHIRPSDRPGMTATPPPPLPTRRPSSCSRPAPQLSYRPPDVTDVLCSNSPRHHQPLYGRGQHQGSYQHARPFTHMASSGDHYIPGRSEERVFQDMSGDHTSSECYQQRYHNIYHSDPRMSLSHDFLCDYPMVQPYDVNKEGYWHFVRLNSDCTQYTRRPGVHHCRSCGHEVYENVEDHCSKHGRSCRPLSTHMSWKPIASDISHV